MEQICISYEKMRQVDNYICILVRPSKNQKRKVSPMGGTVDDIGIIAAYLKRRPYLSQLSRTISIPMSFGTWVRIS